MEPPAYLYHNCICVIPQTSHLIVEVGFSLFAVLLILVRLHSYRIRLSKNESISAEILENWDFKNRLTVLFFLESLIILVSAFVLLFFSATSVQTIAVIALSIICGITFLSFISAPYNSRIQQLVDLSTGSLQRFNKLINTSTDEDKDLKVKELEQVLENSEGESTEEDQKMLQGIVKFTATEVKQIMTPASEMIAVNESESLSEIIEIIKNNGYSRMPVYNKRTDKVIGILHSKDLIAHLDKSHGDWKPLLRPAYFVSDEKMIIDLLEEFQQRKKHLAIALDAEGKYSGIVTLEDIIEEIVGDIADEFDDEEVVYSKLDDQNYIFEARTNLTDLTKILDLEEDPFLAASNEKSTIAGLLSELTGRVPRKNEKIAFHQFIFTVEAADKRQVKRVKLTINE